MIMLCDEINAGKVFYHIGEKNFKNPCIVLLDVYSKFVSPYDGFGDWATPRQPAARLFISPRNSQILWVLSNQGFETDAFLQAPAKDS
jgi:hypothetical protein